MAKRKKSLKSLLRDRKSLVRDPQFSLHSRLVEAFEYMEEDPIDTQKAIHSIAFLLEWASSSGNDDVDRYAALGLSRLLHGCAARIGSLYTQDDVRTLGGDLDPNPASDTADPRPDKPTEKQTLQFVQRSAGQ